MGNERENQQIVRHGLFTYIRARAGQVSKMPILITIRQCEMPKNCVLNLGLERRERKYF